MTYPANASDGRWLLAAQTGTVHHCDDFGNALQADRSWEYGPGTCFPTPAIGSF